MVNGGRNMKDLDKYSNTSLHLFKIFNISIDNAIVFSFSLNETDIPLNYYYYIIMQDGNNNILIKKINNAMDFSFNYNLEKISNESDNSEMNTFKNLFGNFIGRNFDKFIDLVYLLSKKHSSHNNITNPFFLLTNLEIPIFKDNDMITILENDKTLFKQN